MQYNWPFLSAHIHLSTNLLIHVTPYQQFVAPISQYVPHGRSNSHKMVIVSRFDYQCLSGYYNFPVRRCVVIVVRRRVSCRR